MMEHFNPNLLSDTHGSYSNNEWESGAPGQYFEEKPTRWRNVFCIATILGGVLVMAFPYIIPLPNQLNELSGLFGAQKKVLGEKVLAEGGDITVEKPTLLVLKPELAASSTVLADVAAMSAFARDRESGVVLYNKNGYERRSMASITKLMSALVVLERNIDWATTTPVIADEYMADSHMQAGEIYTVDDLWHAALIGSSNKAILSLVDASGWAREIFVARMNEKARELGMGNTVFVEPTGLDERNVSTASDLSLLLDEALKKEEIRDAVLMNEYTLYPDGKKNPHHMWNTNWLLLNWIPNNIKEIRGGKTGYIPSAGYNFIVQVRDEHGHDVDVVVLGAIEHQARFEEAKKIAEWVFANYEWK